MNNKLIRLTENDLHNIVKEAVNRILSEHDAYALGRMFGKRDNRQNYLQKMGIMSSMNGGSYDEVEGLRKKSQEYGNKTSNLNKTANRALGQNPSNNDDFRAGWKETNYLSRY